MWDAFSSCHSCVPLASICKCLAVSGTMFNMGGTDPEEDVVHNLKDLRVWWGDQGNRQFP